MNNRYRNIARLRKYPFKTKDQLNQCWQHIAEYIYAALLQYKKIERHTYPGYDDVDTEDKWEDALDAVLWSLGTIQDKNKMAKFVKLDGEERAAYDAKIRKGLLLFGKHYEHLWD